MTTDDWADQPAEATEEDAVTEIDEGGGEQLENPPGAGTPAGMPLPDPEQPASPDAGAITLSAPAGSGLDLPGFGLSVSDQPATYAPEDAARLQEAAAAAGIELIEGGGS